MCPWAIIAVDAIRYQEVDAISHTSIPWKIVKVDVPTPYFHKD